MKKKGLGLLLSLCCLFGALGFVACDKDGEVSGSSSVESTFGGTEGNGGNGGGGNEGVHTHAYTWKYDGDSHWEECACGDKKEQTVHQLNADGACSLCGATNGTEGLTYVLSEDETYYICTGIGTATETDIVIADIHDGLLVKKIDNQAFIGCSNLTSVTIGGNITSIQREAFADCSGLVGVYITDIAAWCAIDFWDESANPLSQAGNLYLDNQLITNLVIPDGVTTIGNYAFVGCSGLTSVTISNSVATIRHYAFADCSGLTGVYITDVAAWCAINFWSESANPLSQAKNLYFNNQIITDLVIPDGITEIKKYAFYGCSGATSVTIPDGVTTIGNSAFYGCSGATSIAIPDNVTSIGERAFSNCSSVASITIPDGVTSIGNAVFSYCSKLTNVVISEGVTSIGWYAFSNCNELTSVSLPDGITSIGNNAFSWCSGLTSIHIPDSVTSIGAYAFLGCNQIIIQENGIHYVDGWVVDCDSSITTAELRMDTKGIVGEAFYQCNSLTSITIPDGVTGIGWSAFNGCSSLANIIISDSVISIEGYAFNNCNGLTSVYYEGTESDWAEMSINTSGNVGLTSAKVYYYSETPQTEAGKYWHYGTDGKTPVVW